MFTKSRVTDTGNRNPGTPAPGKEAEANAQSAGGAPVAAAADRGDQSAAPAPAATRARTTPSVLSSDLTVTGNIRTQGDIQIEGNIEGDIRAHQLTVGESATIKGEVVADEVIVNGRVIGRVRGLKVRLSATARVEGDIVHKTIAIESGAHFEGSVQRQDDPLAGDGAKKLAPPTAAS
ncbi:bactofilin family protein [Paracoccus tegillarcae]|uniref:Cell shape determination protein CcmA n=1 Tax=Paracoccus tegillarcae TaxID=1529068 RepID=A0A2K9F4C8_9RHOB|nr:polymer-forming cytoskeletal protein [Paracoccus tegillarcae]AUH33991.1 cell shape determination protein CcmA [Paracoccus tegillarcae]